MVCIPKMARRKISPAHDIHYCPNFFLLLFHTQHPNIVLRMCVYVCIYIYIHIWLHRDCIEVPLLTNNTCCKWNILHKSGAARSVDWIFIIVAPPWRWLVEYETQDEMFYHPHNKPLIQLSEWEPDEHPLPTTMAVAVFWQWHLNG